MKFFPCALLSALCIFVFISCHKTKDKPGTPPPVTPPDTLNNWKKSYIGSEAANDIWFTTASRGFYVAYDQYLYSSDDSGTTWQQIPDTRTLGALNLFFLDQQFGFAQGNSQLQVTRDGGNTWTNKSLPSNRAIIVHFATPATGYCASSMDGLFKTSDTGNTWTKVYTDNLGAVGYYPSFSSPDTGYIISTGPSFARTTDAGQTWQSISTNLPGFSGKQYPFNFQQFVSATVGFYASDQGLLKTTDGGATWNNMLPFTSTVNMLKFFDPQTGYCASGASIYKTSDGGQTWSVSCHLATGGEFLGMHFLNEHTGWACTEKGYLVRLNE